MATSYSLIDNANNQFQIVGNELRVASALVAGTANITVRVTLDNGSTKDFIKTISITEAALPLFNPSDARLRWAPPPQSNPTIIRLPQGYFQTSTSTWTNLSSNGRPNGPRNLADDEDVIYLGYNGVRANNSGVNLDGGRHVRLLSAHHRARIIFKGATGSYYVEGVKNDLTGASGSQQDGLVFEGKAGFNPDVYVQNCHITGLQGTSSGQHADAIQMFGPVGIIRIDNLTFDSNYQGVSIWPEYQILGAVLSRINGKRNSLGTPAARTWLYWFRRSQGGTTQGNPLYPVEIGPMVYAREPGVGDGYASVYPVQNEPTVGEPSPGAYNGIIGSDKSVSFPLGSNITGKVLYDDGSIPDFVPINVPGPSYVPSTDFQIN